MRVYISCDMEGISGVVHIDQTKTDGQDYKRARKLMTAEANAAALGAFEAGAKEVVINDAHADMRNIMIEKLDPRVQLISGDLKPLSMVQGIEEGFDAAFFIGYHAGMGAKGGVLDHTYYGSVVTEISVNGVVLNELGINALVAGHFGTPVVLVSGDERVCQEAEGLLGKIETVAVKTGITRYAARSMHPDEARRSIHEGAKSALANLEVYEPFKMEPPYVLKIKMLNSGMADSAQVMPGSTRLDPLTMEFRTEDTMTLFNGLITLVSLGGLSIPRVRDK